VKVRLVSLAVVVNYKTDVNNICYPVVINVSSGVSRWALSVVVDNYTDINNVYGSVAINVNYLGINSRRRVWGRGTGSGSRSG
jgi:hypothetical protein